MGGDIPPETKKRVARVVEENMRVNLALVIGLVLGGAGCGVAADAAAPATVEEFSTAADQAYHTGRYPEAEAAYRKLIAIATDAQAQADATFNLGLCLEFQGRYRDAIRTFRRFVVGEHDSRAPGGDLMTPYRNGRPRALWQIGHCELRRGRFAAALNAFHRVQYKEPFQSWCGNEQAAYEFAYRFYSAVCQEGLGRVEAAVRDYFRACDFATGFYFNPAAAQRLVDLYEAAGQLDDLGRILDEMDRRHLEAARAAAGRNYAAFDDAESLEFSPAATMRAILRVRTAAAAGHWSELIPPLLSERMSRTAPDAYEDWLVIEISRVLARAPVDSTRELLAVASRLEPSRQDWIPYAVGRCATPAGVQWLRENVLRLGRGYGPHLFALGLAGPAGDEILDEIAAAWHEDVHAWVREDWDANNAARGEVTFPPLPRDHRLPASYSALGLEPR
jgi:tetratricopeptide (TPR) repeat protein